MSHVVGLHEYSYAEYLAHENVSNVKHEYLEGEIYARVGGSPEHAALAVAIASSLKTQLEGKGCPVLPRALPPRSEANSCPERVR